MAKNNKKNGNNSDFLEKERIKTMEKEMRTLAENKNGQETAPEDIELEKEIEKSLQSAKEEEKMAKEKEIREKEVRKQEELERQKQLEREKEFKKQQEIEEIRRREFLKQKELEMAKRQKEKEEIEQRMETERQKEIERQMALEKQIEIEKQIELEKQKTLAEQKEMEREREEERKREAERKRIEEMSEFEKEELKEKLEIERLEEEKNEYKKDLINLREKIKPLEGETIHLSVEIERIRETELQPILEREERIEREKNINEEKEKTASPIEKTEIEKQRWKIEKIRKEIEELRWKVEEKIEERIQKMKEIDIKLKEMAIEEESIKSEIERLTERRKGLEIRKNRNILQSELDKIIKERKKVELDLEELLIQKDQNDKVLDEILASERALEEEIEVLEKKEAAATWAEKRELEQKRWKVEEKREKTESEKWKVEEEKRQLDLKIKDLQEKLDVKQSEEEKLVSRIDKLNEFLKEVGLETKDDFLAKEKIASEELTEIPGEKTITQKKTLFSEKKPAILTKPSQKTAAIEEEPKVIPIPLQPKEEVIPVPTEETLPAEEEIQELPPSPPPPEIKKISSFEAKGKNLAQEVLPPNLSQPEKTEMKEFSKEEPSFQPVSTPAPEVTTPRAGTSTQEEKTFPQIPSPQAEETIFPEIEFNDYSTSSIKKIVIRVLAAIISIFVLGFLIWAVLNVKNIFKKTTPQVQPTPEATIPPSTEEIQNPIPFIPVETTLTVNISDDSEIPQQFEPLIKEEVSVGNLAQIVIKNQKEKRLALLQELAEALQIEVPIGIYPKISDDYTLAIFSQKEGKRLILITKIESEEGLGDLLNLWETKITKDGFSALGKKIKTATSYFRTTKLREEDIRFLTISTDDLGICYSLVNNYLVFTSSFSSMEKVIEEIKKL